MRRIPPEGIDQLLDELTGRGYEIVGPVRRDGAVVFDLISSSSDLPAGGADEQAPGSYRLTATGGTELFGTACGPGSAKRFLFPPRERVATVHRDGGRLVVEPSPVDAPLTAIVGLRACDLHAVRILDRVFDPGPERPSERGAGPERPSERGGDHRDRRYALRRERTFLVGIDCSRAGATCFCASLGTGPACDRGFDLALTEVARGWLARAGTPAGEDVLSALATSEVDPDDVAEAVAVRTAVVADMRRAVETEGLRDLLYRNLEHPRWQAVAEACLACGNCTAVCPTCFCHDVVDIASLTGDVAHRDRQWASCFSLEYGHLAGHDVRSGRDARYRQWLTHKFAGWVDQFGTPGCVGCGRCITWCPAGIDITAELAAIRESDVEA